MTEQEKVEVRELEITRHITSLEKFEVPQPGTVCLLCQRKVPKQKPKREASE